MTKYHVPIVGWVNATVEWNRAYSQYQRKPTREAREALWVAYDRTYQGFWPTLLFLLLYLLTVLFYELLT